MVYMKEIALWNCDNEASTMEEIFSLEIEPKTHFLYRIINELKKEKAKSIVIWGSYANGKKCRNYMKKNYGITIDSCVVNEKYMNIPVNQIQPDDDFPFVSVEKWFSEHEDTDVIVDFSFFNRKMVHLYKDKIRRLFVGDIMGVFVFDEPYIINSYDIKAHRDDFCNAYEAFDDDQSRKEYIDFILQKIYGFYNKTHHKEQYFDEELVRMNENEVYVDIGAYNGDSIRVFIEHAKNCYKKIYAFEMDANNYNKLKKNSSNIRDCICINKGIGGRRESLKANIEGNTTSHISDKGPCEVEVDTIDNLIDEKITFIKMDIEGFELQALNGAKQAIENYKPKLAVCAYHKIEDLWMIPEYLKKAACGKYRIYFRNYHNSSSESVLYAL